MKARVKDSMIEERRCSFEVCKLLHEKGFDERCLLWYTVKDVNGQYHTVWQPTHQMACDWLGDIHDLHIIAYPYKSGNSKGWCCYVYKTYNLLGQERYVNETCNSCYEAIEAALKYSLEKLVIRK